MAEHSELVSEMTAIEKMSNQERLKHARKRRTQQMKRWTQREKELNSKRKKTEQNLLNKRKSDYKVHFVPSVMLIEAAARNDVDEVRRLLLLGVSPDSTNEDGLTALHQCCIDDSAEMMKLLVEFGANVNAKDSEQWTPLHAAATCGHIHLVEYLISKNANLLAVNADGNMPYDICEDEATLDFIEGEMDKKGITQEMIDDTRAATEIQMLTDMKRLAEDTQDLEYRDYQGATPLHIASAHGYASVVEFLLDQHVCTDVSDNDLWQPIHAAACWGHPDVIELLVQAGADLGAKTKNGETPYDICEDPDLKERIIQLKCEMETKRASQPQKLRRSQSQNTRSQSVRRTSIREKTQISRREALEEARMRQDKHSGQRSEEDDEAKQQRDTSEKETPADPQDVELTLMPISGKDTLQKFKGRSAKEALETSPTEPVSPKDPDSSKDTLNDLSKDDVPTESLAMVRSSSQPNALESVANFAADGNTSKSLSGESVTVEILVTFNSSPTFTPNPGTLADLKKQRSDMRNSSSRLTVSSQPDLSGKVSRNGHCITATYTYDTPPSPTVSLQRYCSNPADVVGEPQKQGCCVLM